MSNEPTYLENDGFYVAFIPDFDYEDGDGKIIYKKVLKKISIPIPNPNKPLKDWAQSLLTDTLEVALQIYMDKWNFTVGNEASRKIYEALHEERQRRIDAKARRIWDEAIRKDQRNKKRLEEIFDDKVN